ncbi:MAG: aminotransferase class I/II-fold pyridoxal phosphate-dependent enzyme [Planctomycetota bacterium]|nr:aminotransferase class I/II-fold pyridoxal phosphate-dependent enzyme [Planctomycetota bacterium]
MHFPRINFLEWVRENVETVEYNLTDSCVHPVSINELGVTYDDIGLSGNNYCGYGELVDLLATTYGVPARNVVITHGASMAIFLVCAALIEAEDEVILEAPNYEPLYRIPYFLGARVRMLDRPFENGFQIALEDLERLVSRNTKAIILTNLHNPSGVATNAEKLQTIGQIAKGCGASLVVSEVFLDSVISQPIPPVATFGRHMVSIGSLSKIYGLEGLRIGWVVCDETLIPHLRRIENYFSPRNAFPSEKIAVVAMRNRQALLARTRAITQVNLNYVRQALRGRSDVAWVEPDGGTVCFPRLLGGIESMSLCKHLQDTYDTLVVPGDFFWAKGHVRISFGGKPEIVRAGMDNFCKALDDMKRRRSMFG